MIVHDAALDAEPGLVGAAGGAALMMLENARLQADLRASIADLQASRARLALAADAGRREIERNLHDDGDREFDYTSGAEQALERAEASGWTVVSIKDDWGRVFLT